MKVLLLNIRYPTPARPHIATYIKSIKECLEEAGADVDLLIHTGNHVKGWRKTRDTIAYYWKILTFKRFSEYDIVYVNHYSHIFPPLLFHLNNINNLIIHWHGSDVFAPSVQNRVMNKITGMTIPYKAIFIAPSKHIAETIADRFKKDIDNIFISPSGGIDLNKYKKDKKNIEKEVDLGFASALNKEKGADFIIKLSEHLNEIEEATRKLTRLHVIDYGLDRSEYIPLLKGRSDVIIHPVFPKDRVSEFYQKIDILLLPTLRESLGLVALEAMACNIPVVGTDDFALVETISSGVSGERFPLENFEAFLKSVIYCIQHLDKYAPREFVKKNYSRQAVVNGYKELFNKLT